MEQGALPQVMLLEAVTKFWFPRNLRKSAVPSPPWAYTGLHFWSPVVVATSVVMSEKADRFTQGHEEETEPSSQPPSGDLQSEQEISLGASDPSAQETAC
ncbi:unnamed protein product [Rangifer tarandus platyrhynchus]|uniref:Uncharacterized protein n=1 Tax=Rangifer tarandus platyrhynchus TaxID=3082113 RepID=A0AC59YA86_RANTA